MENLPRRTGATELTDDELLLFDFFFDKPAAAHLVRRGQYPIHMNVRYSHGLDDQQLQKTLSDLCQRQLITRESDPEYFDGDWMYGLSPAGGALWEIERRPIWARYCEVNSKPLRPNDWNGYQLLTVLSPSLKTAQAFLEAALATGDTVAKESPPKSRYQLIRNPRLCAYWKEFSEVHAILLKVLPDYISMDRREGEEFDVEQWRCCVAARERLEACRTWWRGIDELDSLRCMFDNG
ncbi:MAG: hypothetical protein GXP26_06595 [Planctomycetes bacterium]|nr:hypothetical protein [Planctomycetota bacterium]